MLINSSKTGLWKDGLRAKICTFHSEDYETEEQIFENKKQKKSANTITEAFETKQKFMLRRLQFSLLIQVTKM